MAGIRSTVAEWAEEIPSHEWQLNAITLLGRPIAEEKLAGILLLQEHVLPSGRDTRDLLSDIAAVLDDGSIADWNTTDWLCVRVLGPIIDRDGISKAHEIAGWADAPGLWRRRCAAVAFVNIVGRGDSEITSIVLDVCRKNVTDPQRFSQTGVGWVLRSLSDAEPSKVFDFVRGRQDSMSREATRMAASRLPDEMRSELGIRGKRRRR